MYSNITGEFREDLMGLNLSQTNSVDKTIDNQTKDSEINVQIDSNENTDPNCPQGVCNLLWKPRHK